MCLPHEEKKSAMTDELCKQIQIMKLSRLQLASELVRI